MSPDLYIPLSDLLEYEEIDNIEIPALVILTEVSLIYNQEPRRTAIFSPPKIVRTFLNLKILKPKFSQGEHSPLTMKSRFKAGRKTDPPPDLC